MIANVLPFRAIVLQSLLLLVVIAIESAVLFRQMKTQGRQQITPKQSVQYAASMNLLSTVLGWFTIFAVFDLENLLPADWTQATQTAVLNFILFNRLSDQSLSFLIVLAFITFFASFAIKQVTLWGLKWLLQSEFPQVAPDIDTDPERAKLVAVAIRDLRTDPRNDNNLNISTVLIANAWSYSAILIILLILSLQFRF
jgi:hypothetical protein